MTQNSINNFSQFFTGNLVNGAVTVTGLPGVGGANAAYLAWIHYLGIGLDYRFTYILNHQGYGGVGSAVLIATSLAINTTGGDFTLTSVTVNAGGQLILTNAIVANAYTYDCRLTTFGSAVLPYI